MRTLLAPAALVICMSCASGAVAAPDEIQVYTEELNEPGRFGLEQHINYTVKGQQTPDYAGQMTSHHVTQITPEFSYGLTRTLEAGLYLPLAFAPDGNSYLNGLRVRLKYIAPREDDEHMFYGLNVEVGRESSRIADSISGMELRPIIGYRDVRWLLSFNPILNMGLAANVSHKPQFEPALKATHSLIDGVRGGLEYYGAYGPLNQMVPSDQRSHSVYAVTDIEKNGFDVNFGIGRGFVNDSDKWVMKAIIALPLE